MNKLIENNHLTLISGGLWIRDYLSEAGKRWLVRSTLYAGLMRENQIEDMRPHLSEQMIEVVIDHSINTASIETINEAIENLVTHLVEGKDQTPNSKAVGGFNQSELNILEDMVKAALTL